MPTNDPAPPPMSATLDAALEPIAAVPHDDETLALGAPPEPRGWRRDAPWMRNLVDEDVRGRHKRIVICADGTWNTPRMTSGDEPSATNVWRFYRLVRDHAADGTPQLAYYHPGVGTGALFDRIVGGAFGRGLSRNILDCYRFLVEQYTPGDHVYLFGFSRGAYTVRSLAGLIRNCGIIDRAKYPPGDARECVIGEAFALYRKRGDDTAPSAARALDFRATHSHPDFRMTCIGVWDTVGALGIPVGLLGRISSRVLYGFHDVTLSSWVDRGFQAIAIDEHRRPFAPTLWQQQPDAKAQGQIVEQVWFTGAHADVGGGYGADERELANLTLRWMVNRVTSRTGLELDLAPLAGAPSVVAMHDSLSLWYRLMVPLTRVIDAGLGQHGMRVPTLLTAESVHPSVQRWRTQFVRDPIPVIGRPYAPANVAVYDERMAQTSHASPAPPASYPGDVR